MKKILIMLTIMLVITTSVYAANPSVQLNGEYIDFTDDAGNKVDAQIINSRTMVPMRKIFELLGAEVDWDGDTKTVTANKENVVIKLQIDNDNATVVEDGMEKNILLDSKPIIINNRTMVPLRFISETLNKQVGWDANNQTAIIIDYDYFSNAIKEHSNILYDFITSMPEENANIKLVRSYEDLRDSTYNTTSEISAVINQEQKNKQNINLIFSGTSELFKEIKEEGWDNINLTVTYGEEGISHTTTSSIISQMLTKNSKTYEELRLDGKYNLSLSDGFRELFNIDDNTLNVNTFSIIQGEFNTFLKLFTYVDDYQTATIKASSINYQNANLNNFDYTKFDNIMIENEFSQVYNLINKLIFNYDIKLDELLYDTSNISVDLLITKNDAGMTGSVKVVAVNAYDERVTYNIEIIKK